MKILSANSTSIQKAVTALKAGQLITSDIANAIEADEAIEAVRIMSVLSCTSLRGVSQKSYGIDLATGEIVANDYPVGGLFG